MGFLFTVSGVLETEHAARAFRALLAASGIAHERIRLDPNPPVPDLPGGVSGRSGIRSRGASATPYSRAVRRGACLVSVDVRSQRDRMRIEELMAAAGARSRARLSGDAPRVGEALTDRSPG